MRVLVVSLSWKLSGLYVEMGGRQVCSIEGELGWETFVVFVPTSQLSYAPPRPEIISGLLDPDTGNCVGVRCVVKGKSWVLLVSQLFEEDGLPA